MLGDRVEAREAEEGQGRPQLDIDLESLPIGQDSRRLEVALRAMDGQVVGTGRQRALGCSDVAVHGKRVAIDGHHRVLGKAGEGDYRLFPLQSYRWQLVVSKIGKLKNGVVTAESLAGNLQIETPGSR